MAGALSSEANGPECDEGFERLEDFLGFLEENAWLSDPQVAASIAEHAVQSGISSAFLGTVPADEVELLGPQYRESLLARGLNPRMRAVLDALAALPGAGDPASFRVYAPEALSEFARQLRGRFPGFTGSEFLPGEEDRMRFAAAPHQDLAALTLPDGEFDAVVSNDVFEHLPDLDRALSEVARVLRPGGVMLATFPMNYGREESIQRAVLEGGEVRHLLEPEYHGDPVDPDGALVFQVPGWEILARTRKAGFSGAEMRLVSSRRAGITASGLAGILMMRAVR